MTPFGRILTCRAFLTKREKVSEFIVAELVDDTIMEASILR